MSGGRPTAMEAAMRAREASLAAGPPESEEVARERYRGLGTLMSSGEVAEYLGRDSVELAVVTYRFHAGGRIEPPVDVVVRCEPSALEGVYRSMAKLLESRQWSSEARVSRSKVAATEVEEIRRGRVG